MRQIKYGEGAVIIGKVIKTNNPQVRLRTAIGGTRLIDMLPGEMLLRICRKTVAQRGKSLTRVFHKPGILQ